MFTSSFWTGKKNRIKSTCPTLLVVIYGPWRRGHGNSAQRWHPTKTSVGLQFKFQRTGATSSLKVHHKKGKKRKLKSINTCKCEEERLCLPVPALDPYIPRDVNGYQSSLSGARANTRHVGRRRHAGSWNKATRQRRQVRWTNSPFRSAAVWLLTEASSPKKD